ncbi:MAG: DegT/DnrJ/EryC1/StrS family aminotransferase [Solirubrobacterales bacterium]|nr:DegT/DnrJ/EryC1/StrS family aminotransferase [Solirubrobacterales bacterium]
MSEWRVPLADVVVSEDELEAVIATYRSGWLSMGPCTEALEADFAAYVGSESAVAVSSGTAALHLICLAAGLGPRNEVIVPSLTFVATANAIRYAGATPVFADVAGLERPWLSAAAAESAIGAQTVAIMAMSYGGHPGDLAALAELASSRGLILLEDAAHGLGGRLDGRMLGTFGLAGAFSFFSNKNLPAGEGGMVVTDDPELADRVRGLRSHAMTSATWERHQGGALGYDVTGLGFNYRIDEPRAALIAAGLGGLDEANRRRAELAAEYHRRLEEVPGAAAAMTPLEGAESAHHLFTVVLDEQLDRDAARRSIEEAGIQTSVHYPPIHEFTAYAGTGGGLPLTEAYARRAITLPLFATMTEPQLQDVVTALASALAQGA